MGVFTFLGLLSLQFCGLDAVPLKGTTSAAFQTDIDLNGPALNTSTSQSDPNDLWESINTQYLPMFAKRPAARVDRSTLYTVAYTLEINSHFKLQHIEAVDIFAAPSLSPDAWSYVLHAPEGLSADVDPVKQPVPPMFMLYNWDDFHHVTVDWVQALKEFTAGLKKQGFAVVGRKITVSAVARRVAPSDMPANHHLYWYCTMERDVEPGEEPQKPHWKFIDVKGNKQHPLQHGSVQIS